ncbi:RNA-directed DNA polymerase from mobile element jockey [Lucilia cuprina]|nr:RNA-directed DNA polymerase from mobile element jockey [Lucilia cuprina]
MDNGLNITILQWNIQGFINNKYALELLVASHKPTIIALQETHIIDKSKHLLHMPGYKVFHHNKNNMYAKSGIALLVRNNLNVTNHITSDDDLLFQQLVIKYNTEIHITNIYRECDIRLTPTMVGKIKLAEGVHHILLGDLNSQNTLWGSNTNSPNGKIWEDFADNGNLVVLNDGSPTLFNTRSTLTAVDVTMASVDIAPMLEWNCLPLPEASDHFPLKISNKVDIVKRQFIPRFNDRKADWLLYGDKVSRLNDLFITSTNINREAAQIKRIIRKAANESIPISRRPNDKNNPVWFNTTISKLISMRQLAWRNFKRCRNQSNMLEYRRSTAKVKKECKIAKKRTWDNFLNSLNPTMDVRYLWSKVNKLRTDGVNSFATICIDNDIISHPRKIADKFAEFWTSISSDSQLAADIVASKYNLDIDNLQQQNDQLTVLANEIDITELDDIMRTLKGSTPARDKITYSMIRMAPTELKSRLCRLYNEILAKGVFPQDWKTAILAPIPKPGKDPGRLEGYRPISLLPVLSKILEKILAKRFWKNAIYKVSKIQHAFIPRHGVHSLCHALEDTLRSNLRERSHSLIISEDIEKAFDRVVLTFIILELNEWGIPKNILKLIKSFLEHRKITVKVDGFFSSTLSLDNGVPQGSPLSVVLYTVYANSLAKAIENFPGMDYIGIYADNIFAITSGSDDDVYTNLNNLDETVHNWAHSRGAVIPAEKTEVLHVCRRRGCSVNTINIRRTEIAITDQMRILGILFTRNLLWNVHVKHLSSKLSKINNLLKLICSRSKGPHINTALDICGSLVTGVLLHGITIYGWTSRKNVKKLNTSINNCYRTASGLLRATPLELLRFEARFQDFQSLLEKSAISMASRSITIPADGLHGIFWEHCGRRNDNVPSAISRIVGLLNEHNIALPQKPNPNTNANNHIMTDTSLSIHNKDSTNPIIFRKSLQGKISSFEPDTIIYTDGSFQNGLTTYGIVEQISSTEFDTIGEARLPDDVGIFSAELAAIDAAISYATSKNVRTMICTDSLSVTMALAKNKNGLYNHIITLPDRNAQILIVWVPSHIGICGNECADAAAKNAQNLQHVTETPCLPYVIYNQYRKSNGRLLRPKYNIDMTRSECVMLGRLRVGKTKFNTQHYYDGTSPTKCTNCDVILSVSHILSECEISKIDEPLDKVIDCTTNTNLSAIRRSLQKHNIQDV